jgi:hypothetical protein
LLLAVIAAGAIALVQIQRAERAAIQEAEVASREAQRAKQAEDRITQQLDVIKHEQAAKTTAETQVAQGKEDLQTANASLKKALERAESESRLAQTESKRAQDAADATEKTNAQLEKLLADERARAEKLSKERRKIESELR